MTGRLDFRGSGSRFTKDYEVNSIRRALVGLQAEEGTQVLWFAFDTVTTVMHNVYDEADMMQGRRYKTPIEVPVLSAHHEQGARQQSEGGFYSLDTLNITGSFEQMRRSGLWQMDTRTDWYLRDRIVYDQVVFRPDTLRVLGQVGDRDIIVSITATEVSPEELESDPQFKAYSER